LRRPVLHLHLDAGETHPGIGSKVLPPLATHWQQPDQLAEYDAYARSAGPVAGIVSRGDAATIDAGALLQTLTDLRRRYPLIVVRASDDLPLDSRLLTDLDGPVLLGEDESSPANGDPREPQNGAETIILRSGPAAASLRDLATLTRECGAQVLRVVPGGRAALANERPGRSAGEPWDSVDWTARHFIKRKVGVALGAGGAKGYAHIGVLEELDRMGVPVDYIAGTSIGAPIAAAVAAGWSLAEIKQHIDAISAHALRPTVPFSSFLSSKRVRREIERISEGKRFDELRLPLAVVAVDLERREEVVLTEGRVTRAIAASFAIPAIYPPVKIGGRSLVDGGLLNPVPIGTVANLGADTVIGVKLTSPVDGDRPRPRRFGLRAPPIVDTIVQAFEVMQWKITTEGAAQADVTIEPIFKGATGLREFSRGHEFIAAGRHAAAAARSDIKALLPWVGT
ncbi:MAG: patatin-like phospholipase family protein, partial [Dehalococcoidia bacterium]